MNELDKKIKKYFPGRAVQKDLVNAINEIVPKGVIECLLGLQCVTDDEASIQTGIKNVKAILRKNYVNRKEAILMRSNIKEKVIFKVIDKISVSLNEKEDAYE